MKEKQVIVTYTSSIVMDASKAKDIAIGSTITSSEMWSEVIKDLKCTGLVYVNGQISYSEE